jgi:DNA-binding transcriptional MerR regulator
MADNEHTTWKIGELARATGLTVRTLHHYDEIGLLAPGRRTYGGHRLYTADDVRRLYRVVALRALGLSLDEVAAWLARADRGSAGRRTTAPRAGRRADRAARTAAGAARGHPRGTRPAGGADSR